MPPSKRPTAPQDHRPKADDDVVDFDAARAERRAKEKPKRVRIDGKVFEVPTRPPLSVMRHLGNLAAIDTLEPTAQGPALNAAFSGIMEAIFGANADAPEVLAMTDEDLAEFLGTVYEVEVPK